MTAKGKANVSELNFIEKTKPKRENSYYKIHLKNTIISKITTKLMIK